MPSHMHRDGLPVSAPPMIIAESDTHIAPAQARVVLDHAGRSANVRLLLGLVS
jgi:hypothetical protein